MSKVNLRIAAGERTRGALLAAARRLFRDGYEAVGTQDVVAAAAVTRGALYHHFADKRALFAAVVDEVAAGLVSTIERAADAAAADPASAVVAGCRAFLDGAHDLEVRRIFLLDAPAVLGWSEWRRIDGRHGFGSLRRGLAACADAGLLPRDDVDAAAHLISGALNEAAFVLASTSGDDGTAAAVDRRMEMMVRALVRPSPGA